jgi:two-component system, LytTR family, response regulator
MTENELPETNGTGEGSAVHTADKIFVRNKSTIVPIPTADILWIEGSSGNYVTIHTASTTHLARTTLASLGERLNPSAFVRIHKSSIVNINAITEMHIWFSGELLLFLRGGTQLRVSRKYRKMLEERYLFLR